MKPTTLLFSMLLGASCFAQSPSAPVEAVKAPLPAGPLLARPEFLQWQVTITTEPSGAQAGQDVAQTAPKPHIFTARMVKTGQIKRTDSVNSEGEKLLKWSCGPVSILKTGDGVHPILMNDNAIGQDFPELAWVSKNNFAGTAKVSGQDCLIFRDRLSILSDAEMNDAKQAAKSTGTQFNADYFNVDAWAAISIDSRLPIAAKKGKDNIVYRYFPTPTTVQEVPPDLKKLIEAEHQRVQDLGRAPARS